MRECAAIACRRVVDGPMPMCRIHWRMVSHDLRQRIAVAAGPAQLRHIGEAVQRVASAEGHVPEERASG